MVATANRPSSDDRIRAALWFAERGFGVFSVWSTTTAGACRCPLGGSCDNAGKHPISGRGFLDATSDPDRIRTLLSAGSEPNYGLVCPDGVFALDVDGEGVAKLADLEVLHGPLPPTLRTATAHGEHIFLHWPDDLPRPIGQLFGFVTRWGSGSNAGYVIGPRSVHASGAVYAPGGSTFEIATIPASWAAAVIEARAPAAGTIVIAPGAYELPETVPASASRYEAIRTYTASLYNRGLSVDDMWPLVRERLAPRFELGLTEPDLRSRFNRVTEKLGERLGAPRTGATSAPAPRTADEIAASSIDAVDLLALDIPPLTWIVPRLLPEGTTVLAGPPKLGKSCLVYQIAVEVAMGGGLLGREIPQGDVLYLALEDGKRRGQTRLRASLGPRTMPRGRLEVRWSSAQIGAGLEDELVSWLDSHPNARLVAIDTLQKVRGRSDARRNAYEVDVEDLGKLQNIFRDRAIGLLIVHHSKKDAGDDFLASVSGTYGITGSVDTTLVIQRKRLEAFGKLVVTGRDVEEIEEPVQFNGLLWQQAPASMAEASFERAEVYKVIEAEGPIFPAGIADRLGTTRESVKELVAKMVATGSIARATGGYVVSGVTIVGSTEASHSGRFGDIDASDASVPRARARTGVPNASDASDAYGEAGEAGEASGTRTTRGRVREADPGIVVVDPLDPHPPLSSYCHFPVDHQHQLRDTSTADPWCEICTPPKEPA